MASKERNAGVSLGQSVGASLDPSAEASWAQSIAASLGLNWEAKEPKKRENYRPWMWEAHIPMFLLDTRTHSEPHRRRPDPFPLCLDETPKEKTDE